MTNTLNKKKVWWVVPIGLVLFAASIIALLVCGKFTNVYSVMNICIAVLTGGILLVYANKDMTDRIIPVKWWFVPIGLGIINFVMLTISAIDAYLNVLPITWFIIYPLCAFIPAVIMFLLGFFRVVNGADALALITVLLVLSPFTAFSTLIPAAWVIIIVSLILGLILWKVKPEWRKGIPYLCPLVLAYAIFGILI